MRRTHDSCERMRRDFADGSSGGTCSGISLSLTHRHLRHILISAAYQETQSLGGGIINLRDGEAGLSFNPMRAQDDLGLKSRKTTDSTSIGMRKMTMMTMIKRLRFASFATPWKLSE